jgi:hypothetical protein
MTRRIELRLVGTLALTMLFGCNTPAPSAPGDTGQVVLAITNAPPDAACLRITAKAATTAVRSVGLTANQSTTSVNLTGLPLGQVQFTGEAFGVACSFVAGETPATWTSDAVTIPLIDGVIANVMLTLHKAGSAKVAVDFAGGSGAANGAACGSAADCASGFCADGVCCNSACTGSCQACTVALTGAPSGTCSFIPAGVDPQDECATDPVSTCGREGVCNGQGACRLYPMGTLCAPGTCSGATEVSARFCNGTGACLPGTLRSCGPAMCSGNSCASSCATSSDCQTGFVCSNGVCTAKQPNGNTCTDSNSCASGFCVDGFCCNSACTGSCQACVMAFTGVASGTCAPVPAGRDPRNGCAQDPVTSCGHDGECDGAGSCRFYAGGTACSAASCMGSNVFGGGSCNGSGSCVVGPLTSCGAFTCAGGACLTSCANDANCTSGFVCSLGTCLAKKADGTPCSDATQCLSGICTGGTCAPSGPVLQWKMDEASGTTALDSSGHALNGTYLGTVGTPTSSTLVPVAGAMGNPLSRAFVRASEQAIRLAGTPSALKPANGLTLSAWYRATSLDSSGAEIISAGDSYILRLRTTQIEFDKRISSGTGGTYVNCPFVTSTHLDGAWHHLAAVTSTGGMQLYVDGTLRCSNTHGENMLYDKGPDFFVGRHGNGQTQWDFEGNIDDVRVYGRALTAGEIANLIIAAQ